MPAAKAPPFGPLGRQGGHALVGQRVYPAPAAVRVHPRAADQAGGRQPVQRRVDRAFRQVERAFAALPQRGDGRVAVGRPRGQDRQQQQVQVTLQPLWVHAGSARLGECRRIVHAAWPA
jgi:hypothetical protein